MTEEDLKDFRVARDRVAKGEATMDEFMKLFTPNIKGEDDEENFCRTDGEI